MDDLARKMQLLNRVSWPIEKIIFKQSLDKQRQIIEFLSSKMTTDELEIFHNKINGEFSDIEEAWTKVCQKMNFTKIFRLRGLNTEMKKHLRYPTHGLITRE